MHRQLAENALTIISNDPTHGTEQDVEVLRRFCDEFRKNLNHSTHPVHRTVVGLLHYLERSQPEVIGFFRAAVHALCSLDALLQAGVEIRRWVEQCLERLLHVMSRRYA